MLLFSLHSLDFEECAHKLLKMDFPDSQTVMLPNSFLFLKEAYIFSSL